LSIVTTIIKIRVINTGIISGSPVRSCFFSSTHHTGTFFQLAARQVARVLSSTLRVHFQQLLFQKKWKSDWLLLLRLHAENMSLSPILELIVYVNSINLILFFWRLNRKNVRKIRIIFSNCCHFVAIWY